MLLCVRMDPHPARRHPGVLPGLGDPQHRLLLEHQEGTQGYRNSVGAETLQKTLFSPMEGVPPSPQCDQAGDISGTGTYLRLRFLWL